MVEVLYLLGGVVGGGSVGAGAGIWLSRVIRDVAARGLIVPDAAASQVEADRLERLRERFAKSSWVDYPMLDFERDVADVLAGRSTDPLDRLADQIADRADRAARTDVERKAVQAARQLKEWQRSEASPHPRGRQYPRGHLGHPPVDFGISESASAYGTAYGAVYARKPLKMFEGRPMTDEQNVLVRQAERRLAMCKECGAEASRFWALFDGIARRAVFTARCASGHKSGVSLPYMGSSTVALSIGPLAARPAPPVGGSYFVDSGSGRVFYSASGVWAEVAIRPRA